MVDVVGRGSNGGFIGDTLVGKEKTLGKLRHVRVGQLWGQEKAEVGETRYRKVKGTENRIDFMTKALTGVEINKYVNKLGREGKGGRPKRSLILQFKCFQNY